MEGSSKLRVTIIGAGISGLAAAVFLQKYPQYRITVFERRGEDFEESSAALGLRSNGIKILQQLGITRQELRAVVGAGYRIYSTQEVEVSKRDLGHGPDGNGEMWLVYRQHLKDALLKRAREDGGHGAPINILYGCQITGVDTETGAVRFANGESITADLIIGADGIHSKVRTAVIPPSHPAPVPRGLSLYRFILPMDTVKDAIGVQNRWPLLYNCDEGPFVTIIAASEPDNRHVLMYPCWDYEQMNFVCAVPDSSFHSPSNLKYSWDAQGNVTKMVEEFQGFPEWLQRVLNRTPEVSLFQVRDQEPLPTYVKGRAVLIGDAAHAMVPYQSQGANQAFEDAEGIDALFAELSNSENIPSILELWDRVRRPRASEIQRGSRDSMGKVATKEAGDAFLSVKPHLSMKEAVSELWRC